MLDLTDKQITQYFRRSYTAVDGLWFVKAEEQVGLEIALALDQAVWQVMAKIQARQLKALGEIGQGLEALWECFTTKLMIEGYRFTTERFPNSNGFRIRVSECPWYRTLVEEGRKTLAPEIAARICSTEYAAWAAEFGHNLRFSLDGSLCTDCPCCVLTFQRA